VIGDSENDAAKQFIGRWKIKKGSTLFDTDAQNENLYSYILPQIKELLKHSSYFEEEQVHKLFT